jgi:catechol 2,3-dioxygenase-like lactoylglutathione lyase family enzyme
MTIKRMDNMGIVVESLDATVAFFTELGMRLEGRAMIEGEWAGRPEGLLIGLAQELEPSTGAPAEAP